jgi:hypothetical protein
MQSNPYLDPQQYASHILHISKLLKNVSALHPTLGYQLSEAVIVLEHHNNALEAQVEAIEHVGCMD